MSTIHFSTENPPKAISSVAEAAAVLAPPPKNNHLIGVEAEALLVDAKNATPLTGQHFPGILAAYKRVAGFGDYLLEGSTFIGLTNGFGLHAGADITVEPGFQPEYGGAPKTNLHQIAQGLNKHLHQLAWVAAASGFRVTMPGLYPLAAGHNLPLIGKERYAHMSEQALKKSGADGLTAMRGTTGVQYNLDTDRDSWERLYRVAFALQPFSSALSTNSPYKAGINTGDASHRSVLWFKNWGGNWAQGLAETVFAKDFSLPKLTGYIAEHLPLPFLVRPNEQGGLNYIKLDHGKTFSELLQNRPTALGDLNESDVGAMVGFAFLPVKPKKHGVIELRGADGSYPLRLAQGALPVGILYDAQALAEAEDLLKDLNATRYTELNNAVIRSGLNATVTGLGPVREIAQRLITIAQGGLERRGLEEGLYLEPFAEIAAGERLTPGEEFAKHVDVLKQNNPRLSLRDAVKQAFLETAIPTPVSPSLQSERTLLRKNAPLFSNLAIS